MTIEAATMLWPCGGLCLEVRHTDVKIAYCSVQCSSSECGTGGRGEVYCLWLLWLVISKYCDECVCLSARISRKLRGRTSVNFSYVMSMAVARSDSGGFAMLCTSGFVDDVVFSHYELYGTLCVFLSGDSVTTQPTKFCSLIKIGKCTPGWSLPSTISLCCEENCCITRAHDNAIIISVVTEK